MRKKLLAVLMMIIFGLFDTPSSEAQLPADLPWAQPNQHLILQRGGIAAVTCGTTTEILPANRFTFGMFNIDGVVPDNFRMDRSFDPSAPGNPDNAQAYHHPSWTVEQIGNVFGVAINERTRAVFLTASSNYGSHFFSSNTPSSNVPAVLRYGDIGGGAEDLEAAGAIYRVDAVTGRVDQQPFAVLPQQETTVTHIACETGGPVVRSTGVGLGNIHYDKFHNQYFVTNIEDGRIYRLGPDGDILDSYDPGEDDNGLPGIGQFTDLVNGIAVEPNGDRLFFGGVSTTNSVPLKSIQLTFDGGFPGIIDNSVLPAGVPNNFHDAIETDHGSVETETAAVANILNLVGPNATFHHISDLEFLPGPNPKLLVGIRVGCGSNWASSYNHTGESLEISPVGGIYDPDSISTEFDVTQDDDFAAEDAYGGVSYHVLGDGSIDYVVTSSDILSDAGPHGIAVFHAVSSAVSPIIPLAAVSYGEVDNGDPKGVGGSVDVSNVFNCLVGDANLDDSINFSDIPAFISVLQRGRYLCEADIDQNGRIDFSDIPLFILVLLNQ